MTSVETWQYAQLTYGGADAGLRYAVAMAFIWMRWIPVALLFGSACAAWAQSAQEPLPPAPMPAPLLLPKSGAPVPLFASKPQDVPPPAPLPGDEETFCSTPTDLIYRTDKPVTAAGKRAGELYARTVEQQIWRNWKVPREINDPWLRGAAVRVKFEIQPDGSLNDPVIMMSSGRTSYDRRALESVKHAAFGPPPSNGPVPFRMCFTFRYNMDREGQDHLPVDVFAKKPTAQ